MPIPFGAGGTTVHRSQFYSPLRRRVDPCQPFHRKFHATLFPFHTKRVPHFFTDVLVVGCGLAGLRAALAVDPDASVVVAAKQGLEDSNSVLAQGGIAATIAPDDSFENHIADTLRAGVSLCDSDVVERVVREAPAHIEELIRWGVRFDQEGNHLALAREGGHGRQRIVHALGDASGKEIMRAMIARAKQAETSTSGRTHSPSTY